jgi:multimeric flavodoxin WrbA
MKLLAIAGSPRKKGNSTSLMLQAVEGARERGATVEVLSARDLKVAGCLACESCKRSAEAVCVQNDDMQAVYAAIRDCDALLLASPVYFYGLTAQLKAIVDRCYALMPFEGVPEGEQPVPRITPGIPFYLITTQADAPVFYGLQVYSTIAYGMTWLGMKPAGELVATGLQNTGDWQGRDDLIAAAWALVRV